MGLRTVRILTGLAFAAALLLGRPAGAQEALPTVAEAEAALARARAPRRPYAEDVLQAQWGLAQALLRDRRLAESEAVFRSMRRLLLRGYAPDSAQVVGFDSWFAVVLAAQDKWDEARPLAESRYASTLAAQGPDAADTHRFRMVLGSALTREGRIAEAEPLVRASFDHLLATEGAGGGASEIAATLARIYAALGRADEAEAVLAMVEGADTDRLANALERARLAGDNASVIGFAQDLLARPDLDGVMRITAENALLDASIATARAGGPEDGVEAELLAREIVASRPPGSPGAAFADNALGSILLLPQGRTPQRLADGIWFKQAALGELEHAIGADHPTARVQRLDVAMMFVSLGLGAQALSVLEPLAGAGDPLPAELAAAVVLTRARALSQEGDLPAAYGVYREAGSGFRAYALARERVDGATRYLARRSQVFGEQVEAAWALAGTGLGGSS